MSRLIVPKSISPNWTPPCQKKGKDNEKNKAINPFKTSIILGKSCFVFLFIWSKFLKVYLRVKEKSLCFEAGSPVNTFHPFWVNFVQEKPDLKYTALILQFDWRSNYHTLLSIYFFWFVWLLQNGNHPNSFDSWQALTKCDYPSPYTFLELTYLSAPTWIRFELRRGLSH